MGSNQISLGCDPIYPLTTLVTGHILCGFYLLRLLWGTDEIIM